MQTWPPGYENTSAVSIRISIIKQAMDSILTLLVKNMKFLRWHNSLAGELCPNVFFILLLGLIETLAGDLSTLLTKKLLYKLVRLF